MACLVAQPQFVTPVLYRSYCACSRAIWDRAGIEIGKGRDSATLLVMSPLEFMQRRTTGSVSHDWAAKVCFAAINLGTWMPGLGRDLTVASTNAPPENRQPN
jgi:hypothetical protein